MTPDVTLVSVSGKAPGGRHRGENKNCAPGQMTAERRPARLCGGHTRAHTHTDTNMDSPTAAILLCFLLSVLVQSAPLVSPPDASPAFREAAERAKLLLEKILRDVPTVHTAAVTTEGLALDSSQASGLQMMTVLLGIPPAPVLKPLSQHFTMDMLVGRMLAGCRQYQGLLGVLSDRLSGLTELNADLRDLLTHIAKMREVAELAETDQPASPDLASHLHGDYEVQVAAHVTLTQLRSFCHDMIRSLRTVASQWPRAH